MEEIVENFKTVFRRWNDFSGRSRRREYWYFALANFVISIGLGILDNIVLGSNGYGALQGLYSLIALVPGLAVSFRRLHDIGKSAWWLLIALIPIVGLVVLIYFTVKDSDGDNVYGPNPKAIA